MLEERAAEVGRLQAAVERMRAAVEEQRMENTELVSKVTSQSSEVSRLLSANTELQSRVNMAELLAEQVGGGRGKGAGCGGFQQVFPYPPAVCRKLGPAPWPHPLPG